MAFERNGIGSDSVINEQELKEIFVHICRAPLDNVNGEKVAILQPESNGEFIPLDLSMDWLNDHLYILVEVRQTNQLWWQISRCDLNGRGLTVVYGGLRRRPTHFEVDPYNGYLFWTISRRDNFGYDDDNDKEMSYDDGDSGLYRLDLADMSNGVHRDTSPSRLLTANNIGSSFVLDYTSFKILLPLQNNTVISIDLDGKKREDIRNASNTQSPMYGNVCSMDMMNQVFYWTDGQMLMNEELHQTEKLYYNNKKESTLPSVSYLRINVSSAQPVPVPVNPPSNVQALLLSHRGKVSWTAPHLLGIQGKGAWQNWNYHLEITNEDTEEQQQEPILINNVKGTNWAVDGLRANTNYKFRVAAYTEAGRGPWGTEFRTRTIRSKDDRYLLWSTRENGLLASDVLGENIEELIGKDELADHVITDMAWHEDVVYFVLNRQLRYYNRTSRTVASVGIGMDSLQMQSIAVDWLGMRLYWFNVDKQVIYRANIYGDGYDHEPLVTVSAQDMVLQIDSVHGFLYFSTGHAVRCCRLNGEHMHDYFSVEAYSGKQVMGLALDLDEHRVYWIVRSFNGSTLFSARMAQGDVNAVDWIINKDIREDSLKDNTLQGPLAYFSDRLLWLRDEKTVILANMTGRNLANIRNSKLTGLRSVVVIDPTQRTSVWVDDGAQRTRINVSPEAVTAASIRLSGNWSTFNITWPASRLVNYGEVFYDVHFLMGNYQTNRTWFTYNGFGLQPYSQFEFSIQANTYWAKSELTKINLTSPAAEPSVPINQRAFIRHHVDPFHGINVTATIRWSAPLQSNGPISGYILLMHLGDDQLMLNRTVEGGHNLEKVIPNLRQNATYNVQVQAYSKLGGLGPLGPKIEFSTTQERSVPNLLAAVGERIVKVDLDLGESKIVVNATSPVRYMAYVEYENLILWINENNELMTALPDKKIKLATCSSTVTALTVDWVERVVYWSQRELNGSAIFRINLNNNKKEPYLVPFIHRPGIVTNLVANPIEQQLLWIESVTVQNVTGSLFIYSLNDSKTIQNNQLHKIQLKRNLILIDANYSEFVSFNRSGHAVQFNTRHWTIAPTPPPSSSYAAIKTDALVDSSHMYWSQNGTIFAVSYEATQQPQQLYTHYIGGGIVQLLAYARQTYPPTKCLLPLANQSFAPELVEASKTKLKLRVNKIVSDCGRKLPAIRYTILYKKQDDKRCEALERNCKTRDFFSDIIEIGDLSPFVSYQFQMAVTNYFAAQQNMPAHLSEVVAFKTALGAPTEPRNVSAQVVSPTEALVRWWPPENLNSIRVYYEVHYQTQNGTDEMRNLKSVSGRFTADDAESKTINLTQLLPNQPYIIEVKASTSTDTWTFSAPVHIRTLPEPADIQLKAATPYSLHISWPAHPNAQRYVIEYFPEEDIDENGAGVGHIVYDSTEQNASAATNGLPRTANYLIENLQPKFRYRFSIRMFFGRTSMVYKWPTDSRFTFETLGDCPAAPGLPNVEEIREKVYKISWETPRDNGATILEYSLEAWMKNQFLPRSARSVETAAAVAPVAADYSRLTATYEASADHLNYTTMLPNRLLQVDETERDWIVYYNGSENYWITTEAMPIIKDQSFRVRARNAYGWSGYSNESVPFVAPIVSEERISFLMFVIFGPVLVIFFIVLAISIVYGEYGLLFFYFND